MPVTRTAGYTVTDAIRDAEMYVMAHPSQGDTPAARIFYLAIMNYFRELGISEKDNKRIVELWVEAEFSTWQKGWLQGWNGGYATGKATVAPPF